MAKCEYCNRPLILKEGKCIYCGLAPKSTPQSIPSGQPVIRKSKPIKQRRSFENRPKTIEELSIKVTSPGCDDMGAILDRLGIRYVPFDGDYLCDIIFLNCCTSDQIDSGKLKSFVQNGGILYASDLTDRYVTGAWPDLMMIDYNTNRCTIQANIMDSDLRQYLGNSINVEFNMSSWAKIIKAQTGKVLMESSDEGYPIMMEFSIGQGKVFFTSFHNHAQTEEAEDKLLRLLVIKQVASATKQSFQQTIQSFSGSL